MEKDITIQNFESFIDDIILMRGLDYYENGYVIGLDVFGNEVSALVSGSYDYEVKIIFDEKGHITYHYCHCPYDGIYCKHEVAVLYALREYFKSNPQNKGEKEELKELIKKQDKEILAEILYDLACYDRKLREKLYMKFKQTADTANDCIKIAEKFVNIYSDRDGINIDNIDSLLEGLYIAVEKIEDIMENNTMEAINAYLGIVDLLLDIEFYEYDHYDIYYYSYSGGDLPEDIDELIDDIFDRIEVFIGSSYNDEIFELLYSKMNGNIHSIYYDICVKFCKTNENRKRIESLISKIEDEEIRLRFQYGL